MVTKSIMLTSQRISARAATIEKEIRTDIYQAEMLHKEFAQALNVVIIVKTNLKTGAWAQVIFFSSDLRLEL